LFTTVLKSHFKPSHSLKTTAQRFNTSQNLCLHFFLRMRRNVYSYLREIYVHKISNNASVEWGFSSWNRVEPFLSAWIQNQALFMGISATQFVKLERIKRVKDLYPVITQVLS